ncbi:DUF3775 domain-containing protein [Peribacillus simplex]|uniref:hypothetical protein n=1 Tax=Peribacillus simplex TaxID=1478 RepID=UPI003B8D95BD
MPNQLFISKKYIFKDVIRLAEEWRIAYDKYGSNGGSIGEMRQFQETPEYQKIKVKKNVLSDYLLNLSFDDVKMVQTVMYLGRDKDYKKSQSNIEIYKSMLEDLGTNGWNTKEIEVRQIAQKLPLADYLRSGLEILNVSI